VLVHAKSKSATSVKMMAIVTYNTGFQKVPLLNTSNTGMLTTSLKFLLAKGQHRTHQGWFLSISSTMELMLGIPVS